MEKILKRSEVAIENTWATTDIFESDEKWEEALNALSSYPKMIADYKGKLCTSADSLCDYLMLEDKLTVDVDAVYSYAHLCSDVDTSNSKYKAMSGKAMTAYIEIATAASFAVPEIMSVEDDVLEIFYKECPKLEFYREYLTRLRESRAHTLSESEEKLLTGVHDFSGASSKIGSSFRNADLKFPDVADCDGNMHQLTQGSYIPYVQGSDRVLRKNAFDALYHMYGQFRNTTADMLDGQFRQLKFFSRARKYGSSLEAALTNNEVPVEVYRTLIDTVHKNIGLMHRYMSIRKKAMGLDELHMYDIYPTLVGDAERKITFDEAKKIALEALKPLGSDYVSVVKHGFENRWIDVYENEGKRGGAYSSGARPHPYVLLNHEDSLDSMFTLVHEMGHSMHSYLSKEKQAVRYSDYVIFVAEVASTCNEAILMNYLLEHTDDKKQEAYLINYFLEQFRTTLYRQTMFAEFELKANEIVENGGTLTADELCRIYHELNELYYGPDTVIDEEIDMEWARIPHFFMNYYVFQYATGFSAAMALSNRILNGGEGAVKDYLNFLSGGCSKKPIELLKDAGVDMTTAQPIEEALSTFEKLLDRFEQLI